MDPQRAFEVEAFGFPVLVSAIDEPHARELADAVSIADAFTPAQRVSAGTVAVRTTATRSGARGRVIGES